MKRTFLIIAAVVAFMSTQVSAESFPVNAPTASASVSGKVVDNTTGETLAGVRVVAKGTTLEAFSDLDGNFSIDGLKPGNYTLILSMISYKNSMVENVELLPGEKEEVSIKLDNN